MWSSSQAPFDPPGVVLFRLPFNVDTASAADFNWFIQQVEQELCSRIQRPRYHGSGTTVLPCPGAPRRWFVIVLVQDSQDREMAYSVLLLIDAERIYLRGYQSQDGTLFEFEPEDKNLPQRYL